MSKFGNELIASLKQAAAHAKGRKVRGMRVTTVEMPDVKAIRRSLRMSRQRFCLRLSDSASHLEELGAGPALS
jgi:putative transcriptional regulator